MQVPKAVFLVVATFSTLSGCVLSGGGLEEAVDRTATNTIQAPAPPPRNAAIDESDRNTVRNAVSSADIEGASAQTMAWANADTGASGVISGIEEHRAGDVICRQFRTSRQRFDGVALYQGEACTKGRGEWTLTKFNEGG